MSEAYSVYWPQQRWRRAATVRQRLTVLFGGPHSSEHSFRRATVQPGDLLYPIGVCDQVLYVLGRMRVREIVPADDDKGLLEEYFARHSAWRFLAPPPRTSRRGRTPGQGGTPPHADMTAFLLAAAPTRSHPAAARPLKPRQSSSDTGWQPRSSAPGPRTRTRAGTGPSLSAHPVLHVLRFFQLQYRRDG